jgi:hypothetical protein
MMPWPPWRAEIFGCGSARFANAFGCDGGPVVVVAAGKGGRG